MSFFSKIFNTSQKSTEALREYKYEDFSKMIEKSCNMKREIYIGSLTPDVAVSIEKIIRFWNSVDDELTTPIGEREPIKIYINSFGGSLSAALTIIDAIKLSKTMVFTINIGNVFKEAFYIFLAGHKRYAYPRSTFLYEKELTIFDATDAAQSNYADFCEKQSLELKDMLLDKTKVTENEYTKRKTWWLSAEKAYEFNICNEVLRTKFM